MYYRNEKFDTVLYQFDTGEFDTYNFNYDLGVWQDITPDSVTVNSKGFTPIGTVPPFSYEGIDHDAEPYVMWPGTHPDELRAHYPVGYNNNNNQRIERMGYYINPDKTLIMEPFDATANYDLVEDDGITEDDYIAELTVFEWDNDHKAWRHLSDLPSEWQPHITPKGDDHPGIPLMMEWHRDKAPIGNDIIGMDNGDALYPPTYN